MDDEMIIKLYFDRSEDAISETDKKYGAKCRATAYNILRSREDSEECVSDTYLRLWDTIPPKHPEKLGAFVLRVARNLALNLFKSNERLRRGGGYKAVDYDEIAGCLPSSETVESAVDRAAVLKAVESFLSTLPRDKRNMFVRRYFYCCTFKEIADAMHLTEGSVKMSLQRTREKLREYLEKEGIGI